MHKLSLSLATLVALFTFVSTPTRADTPPPADDKIHDETGLGIAITTGNADSQSINAKQNNSYAWGDNAFKLNGKYLSTSANGVDSARYWTLGLRYERQLWDMFSVFAGQAVESDVFSGYVQRYNTDVGGKYFIYKQDDFYWDVEGGYRYTIENRLTGQVNQNYLRFYTEGSRNWTKTFTTKADVEYLPNLTVTNDYQLNAEIAATAQINDVFGIQVGYLVKYRHLPPPPATQTTDTQFTTSLVAKL